MGLISCFYLSYLSQPRCEQQLYRVAAKIRASRIVEIGMSNGRRARRMIEVARCYHTMSQIQYTGIDLFEARSGSDPPLSLKQAFQMLRPMVGKLQLTPGDPCTALARVANGLIASDLIVISADHDEADLVHAWFYLPRMLHPQTVVFWEYFVRQSRETRFVHITHDEIAARVRNRQTNSLRAA